MSEFNWEAMLEEIAESLAPNIVDRDEGWFTINDISDHSYLERSTIARSLNRKVRAGELEKQQLYDPSLRKVVNCYRVMD